MLWWPSLLGRRTPPLPRMLEVSHRSFFPIRFIMTVWIDRPLGSGSRTAASICRLLLDEHLHGDLLVKFGYHLSNEREALGDAWDGHLFAFHIHDVTFSLGLA